MRRRDREIKDMEEIVAIIATENVCHLAMCADNKPYVIPMIYIYNENHLYFHCAEVGMKLDILRQNDAVCFEIQRSTTEQIVENTDKPCDWGFAYESIIGFGKARLVTDREEKIRFYDLLVAKMEPEGYVHSSGDYTEKKITGTYVIDVTIESMTGKRWDGNKPGLARKSK